MCEASGRRTGHRGKSNRRPREGGGRWQRGATLIAAPAFAGATLLSVTRLLRAFDALDDDALGFVDIAPAVELRPFAGFEVLIVGEEMLDLLHHDRRHVDRKRTRLNSSH